MKIRTNPMIPRIAPRISPEKISLRITYHQLRNFNSPSANERMIRLAACEPEFPPLDMINGTNSASTTARAISSSK